MVSEVLRDVTGDGQDEVRKSHAKSREGCENILQPLLRHDTADEKQHARVVRDLVGAPKRRTSVRRGRRDWGDAIRQHMRRCGHSEGGQLFSLERREGEDTRRTVQVGPADEAMIQPLLERLERPSSE